MIISTHYDPKPIPSREYDWIALPEDYDCDYIDGRFVPNMPCGYGATEQDALLDLYTRLQEAAEEREGNRRTLWGILNGGR